MEMNDISGLQDPVEAVRRQARTGTVATVEFKEGLKNKCIGNEKTNSDQSDDIGAQQGRAKINGFLPSVESARSIVCNGVGYAEPAKDEPQNYSKMHCKMLPHETLTCPNVAAMEVVNKLSTLSLNGLDHLKDEKPLASLHNTKLRIEVDPNKNITDFTNVSETQSDSSRSVISHEGAFVHQEGNDKCASNEEDMEKVSTSSQVTKCATLPDKGQLVMCCDSPNQLLTNTSKGKSPLENIENQSSTCHSQISQKEMGNGMDRGMGKSINILETPAKEKTYTTKNLMQSELQAAVSGLYSKVEAEAWAEAQGVVSYLSDNVESAGAEKSDVTYVVYESELNMPDIIRLIQKDLSEPYSIYTYRYFIHNWPHLCLMAKVGEECVGAIVCKLDYHKKVVKRGYIAMLAVDSMFRKRKIGSTLVRKAIETMMAQEADELPDFQVIVRLKDYYIFPLQVVLETEITNQPALRLYENLGFVRDKRLFRYYLNGVDALRLKLWLR